MDSIRFRAPSAAAAFILVDLLVDKCETRATRQDDGTWLIAADLNGSARSTVPQVLSSGRDWLAICGLSSASVGLDEDARPLEEVAFH
jgi:hypothetical protein